MRVCVRVFVCMCVCVCVCVYVYMYVYFFLFSYNGAHSTKGLTVNLQHHSFEFRHLRPSSPCHILPLVH